MNILTTLGRRALTTLTATAIVAGGVVAPHATAEEVKKCRSVLGLQRLEPPQIRP
ncbi:hypothetical protein NY046_11345 [Corynebacterium diphtheriae bv. gravis]|nr:hypothetical protein NY046_11345 [Corynebacterium diphtheriae bv. gravis]